MRSATDVELYVRFRESLERSRARRAAARQARRRRLRARGGSVSVLAVVLAMGSAGAALSVAERISLSTGGTKVGVTLRIGDRGPAVAAVQRRLGVGADGIFGALTHNAVTRFQRGNGLVADGIVGPATRAALRLRPFSRESVVHADKLGRRGGSRRSGGLGSLPEALVRIAQCESGGDPTAVSADGRYRGKYQFARATWKSWGGRGSDPAAAPEAEQDRVALRAYRALGTAPWPSCG